MKKYLAFLAFGFLLMGCKHSGNEIAFAVQKSESEWRENLDSEAYYVLRQNGTEAAFSSGLNYLFDEGIYLCAACENPLYKSENKFESGTGWPSFDKAIDGNVAYYKQKQFGQTIIEAHCANCGGHLGHVFNDGPLETTGKRHCINGVALKFKTMEDQKKYPIEKSENEWREQLGVDRYRILRQQGTEYPNTGEYNLHFEKGTYACGGCHTPLFKSDNKFESNCGWPSFDQAIEGAVAYKRDTSHGMIRTEVVCSTCGGHLGHVFEDGPRETTGQRYCINSLAMDFQSE